MTDAILFRPTKMLNRSIERLPNSFKDHVDRAAKHRKRPVPTSSFACRKAPKP